MFAVRIGLCWNGIEGVVLFIYTRAEIFPIYKLYMFMCYPHSYKCCFIIFAAEGKQLIYFI